MTNGYTVLIFQLVQFRFQDDVKLWMAHIQFSTKRVGRPVIIFGSVILVYSQFNLVKHYNLRKYYDS